MNDVIYLSAPAQVHMADEWFNLATPRHFWIRRRFDVLRRLARSLNFAGLKVGEIGCGHGLVQQQLEQEYGVKVDGFDLNDEVLRHSVATEHPRFFYNILDRHPKLAGGYDLLVLFDVIEHIVDEHAFLEAVLFHLKPGGRLLINVPAFMSFYSRYDQVIGHQRRYTLKSLEAVCARAGLRRLAATYWGLPYVPLLLMRKLWLARQKDPLRIARRGYKPPGRLGNLLLIGLGCLEPLPQRLLGSSLMAIYLKETPS
jgi:SAM-dependent methyltransferase